MLLWPLVLITTVLLYAAILVVMPFSSTYATIFLFALIAFWSRMPGVGIPHPMYFLYNLDLIDVFCVVISINLGGPTGAIFAFTINMWSRACGVYPYWEGVTKDSIFQAILCFFLPLIYSLTGSLFIVTMFFTIGRSFLFLTLGMIVPHNNFITQLFKELQFLASLIIINGFYISIFGKYFDNLLEKGVVFNWPLFIFATVVILIGYAVMRKKSTNSGPSLFRVLARKVHKKKRPQIKETNHLPIEQVYGHRSNDNDKIK